MYKFLYWLGFSLATNLMTLADITKSENVYDPFEELSVIGKGYFLYAQLGIFLRLVHSG